MLQPLVDQLAIRTKLRRRPPHGHPLDRWLERVTLRPPMHPVTLRSRASSLTAAKWSSPDSAETGLDHPVHRNAGTPDPRETWPLSALWIAANDPIEGLVYGHS